MSRNIFSNIYMVKKPVSKKFKSRNKLKTHSKDHLSKTEVKEVKAIVAGKPEVKYLTSSNNNYNINVYAGATTPLATGSLSAFSTSQSGFVSMLAQCAQGTGPNERIGLKIQPIKARTTWTFSLLNPALGNGAGISGPQNFEVHLYVVEPKGYGNVSTVATIPSGAFLLQGNGLTQDPSIASNSDNVKMLQIVNRLPVNKNLYKVRMHKKFHISKNGGNQNLSAFTGATVYEFQCQNTPQDNSIQTITYDWIPPKFKYNNPTDIFPNNHNPLFLVWATPVDGARFPTNNGSSGFPDIGMLTYGYRNEYWYTDS